MRACLPGRAEAIPIKSRQRLPKHELSKVNNRHAHVDSGESSRGVKPTQRAAGSQGMLRAGEIAFPREKDTNWLSSTK